MLPMLAACGKGGEDPADVTTQNTAAATTADPASTTAPAETDKYEIGDQLPTDLNYNGESFHFLVWEQSILEYDVESVTGDMINDAV